MEKINKKINKNNGFTLVELMVASSIFAIVMLTLIGSLLITFGAAKNSRALRLAMDNVSFSLESMTRSIRMGTNYTCLSSGSVNITQTTIDPRDCPSGGTLLIFTPQSSPSSHIGYQLSSSTGSIMRYDSLNPSGVSITDPSVTINNLNFIVKGSSLSDSYQASVYITVKGTVTVKGVPSSFSIQTLASQRNF